MSEKKLGTRISGLRAAKEMSREQLSEQSGVPLDFIVALEEDNLYPSIGPLQKLSRALGVRLGTFMDDVISKDPVITRKEHCHSDLVMQKVRNKAAHYTYYSLGKGKSDRNMEPFFIEIGPDENDSDNRLPQMHQGEEFIIVHSGRLLVRYGNEEHILEPGDSVYFNSTIPHYVGACGGESCSIYAVIYNPA